MPSTLHQIMEAVYPTPRYTLLIHVRNKRLPTFAVSIRSCRSRLKCKLTLVPFDPENTLGLNESVVRQDVVWNVKQATRENTDP